MKLYLLFRKRSNISLLLFQADDKEKEKEVEKDTEENKEKETK